MPSDYRPPLSSALDAFGVAATVTRPAPDDTPIETVVLWPAPLPTEVPLGGEFQRQEAFRIMGIPIADVPTVPTGTLIAAPEEKGLPVRLWRTDGEARREYDHVRVSVLPCESV